METGTVGESHVEMKAEITNQGMLKIAIKPPKARERHGTDPPSQLLEGIGPADALILDFCPPELYSYVYISIY